VIRPFDGSLADAEGLLDVERAVFDECPYSARQVQAFFSPADATSGAVYQRAWVALGRDLSTGRDLSIRRDLVVGFVIAFPTTGLQGTQWEIDLLAVLPEWRGRRLGTRLIRTASACGATVAPRVRAFVAVENGASARAFSRVGLRPVPETYTLLIYRPDPTPTGVDRRSNGEQLGAGGTLTIRETTTLSDVAGWLPDQALPAGDPNLTLLLAERDGQPAGYAELITVQTLLYRGTWIESLRDPDRAVREALIDSAVNRAAAAGLDEVGAMVPAPNWPLRDTLLARGFRSLGEFRRFAAGLPLPGLAATPSEAL
jgi:ribosomal protein S18 acetylase RimI-like enzyme